MVSVGYADNANRKDGINVIVYNSENVIAEEATTIDNLVVEFNGIAVGTGYRVVASAEGYGESVKTDISVSSAGIKLVSVPSLTNKYGSVCGTVTDTKGNAIENALVKIGDYTAFTDASGHFIKIGLALASYTVTISKEGYTTQILAQTISVESSETTDIGIVNLASVYGSITGTVSVNDSGSVEGITVTASLGGTNAAIVKTDAHGKYTISNLQPGRYTLKAEADGYALATRSVDVAADAETTADVLALSNLFGTVSGKVTDTKGSSIEDAIVKIGDINILTTATGFFSKTGIGLGNYTITVSKDGYSTKTLSGEITIESSTLTDIGTVQLASVYGSITGSITVNDNKTLEGIHISAVSSDGKNSYSTMTNAEGMYLLSNVVSGQYSLSAKQLGYTDASDTVVVDADKQSVAPTLYLAAKYGSISGKVSLADSVDNSGVIITLKSIDDESIAPATLSGVDGIYTFDNLSVAGQYAVTFSKEGFVSNSGKTIFVELGKNEAMA